jgi:hypothetical protein
MIVAAGSNPSIDIQIVNDSGIAVTGLVAATITATVNYVINGLTAQVSISLSDLSTITSAYSSGGIKERSGGHYRLDLPALAVATAGTSVEVYGETTGQHIICPAIDVGPLVVNVSQINAVSTSSVTTVNANIGTTQAIAFDANNYQKVDLVDVLGTAATAATAGILDVNTKNLNNVSTSSVTTINANQGTTQPVNYTGTGSSALVKSDMQDIAGSAVNAASAQIGVNIVQINAQTASASGAVTFPNATLASTANITTVGAVSSPVQVDNIGSSSAALNVVASSFTQTTGTVTSGTYTNTFTLDGSFHVTAAAAGTLDEYYVFNVGTTGQIATGFQFNGYLAGAANTLNVFAYNWTSSAWDQIGTLVGVAGTPTLPNETQQEYDLINNHTNTSTGNVQIRFQATGLTLASLYADRLLTGYTTIFSFPTNFASQSIDSSGRVLLQPSQPSVVIPTVTTVTNQLTAAQIATGVFQDTTSGDFTVSGSIGKSLFTSGNAPGASSGLALVGSNMGTVTGGTITTVTNLTNAPTSGDLTATMKASVTTAATASTPTVTVSMGTGTGQINLNAGNVPIDMTVALPTAPVANTIGEALFIADILGGRINTAQAGASTTITLDSGASSDATAYVGDDIYLYGGMGGGVRGTGQRRTIVAYNTSTKVATVNRAWDTNPDNTTKFITLPTAQSNLGMIQGVQITTPATAGVLDVNAKNVNNVSTGSVTTIDAVIGTPTVGSTAAALSTAQTSLNTLVTGVVVTTNNDKTGYSLTVTPPTASTIASTVWQDATGGDFTVSGSIGKSLFTVGDAPGTAGGLAIVGSNMGNVVNVTGSVNGQLTGPQTATAIWQDATGTDFTTAGSIGKSLFTTGNFPGTAGGMALAVDSSGRVNSFMVGILTTLLTETTVGWLAAAFKKFFNLGSPTSTMNEITLVDTTTNLTNAASNGDFTATMKTSITEVVPSVVSIQSGLATASQIPAHFTNGTFASDGVFSVAALANAPTGSDATPSQIATAVWQDNTSGDFTVAGSIGKSLFTNGDVPGAAGGIAIVGSNMGTVSSVTGSVNSVSSPVTVTGTPSVNVTEISGSAVNPSAAQIGVNVVDIGGSASQGAAGYVGVDWAKVDNPTATVGLTNTTISTSQVVSVDTDAIAAAVAAALGAADISVVSPLSQDGTVLILVNGDSYSVANGRSLIFNITDQPGLVGSTPHLRVTGLTPDLAVAPAILSATQTITFNDVLTAVTQQLPIGQSIPYQIHFIDGIDVATPLQGLASISRYV